MRFRRTLLAGAAILALAGVAWSQSTVIVQNLTGNEVIEVTGGGPGGTGYLTTVNALRNAAGYLLVGTLTGVTTVVPNTASKVINTTPIASWPITLPPTPFDGETVALSCTGGAASPVVGVTLPAGVTIVGTAFTTCPTGGAAANGAEYEYSVTTKTWYRIQ